MVCDVDAGRLEAGGAELGGGGLGRHDQGRGLAPGQRQPALVEGPAPGREAVGVGPEGQVVDRHHQRPPPRRRHRQARSVDQVTRRPHRRPAEPVPGLVAPPSPGEALHPHAGLGQVPHEPLDVPPDASGDGLVELPGLERHRERRAHHEPAFLTAPMAP